uniref:BD-FAE-like domain-containing protein n=1 Tax=uncultured organism TaxID=155900 RepID=G3CRG0_9ZZZZ|nr:hypothetical protein [uncultured organism]
MTPSDASTSIVIHPDTSVQIKCGNTALSSFKDVVFAKPTLPNGKTMDLNMDILVPKTPGKKPLVIYVPGGGFTMAMKEGALDLRNYLAESGFVVASIEYRTAPKGAHYRDGIADVKSAVRFLRAHASEYDIEPAKVGIWGESAGGYLVGMVGVTNGDKSFDVGDNLDQSSDVQAVADKFGPADVSKVAVDFDPDMQKAMYAPDGDIAKYIGGFTADGNLKDPKSNAVEYVSAAAPPFQIFHGNKDQIVSPSQTLVLHNALVAKGASSVRYVVDGANHGDMAFAGKPEEALPWSSKEVMDLTVAFFKQHLSAAEK